MDKMNVGLGSTDSCYVCLHLQRIGLSPCRDNLQRIGVISWQPSLLLVEDCPVMVILASTVVTWLQFGIACISGEKDRISHFGFLCRDIASVSLVSEMLWLVAGTEAYLFMLPCEQSL